MLAANSPRFCLSGNVSISPFLKDRFPRCRICGRQSFSFRPRWYLLRNLLLVFFGQLLICDKLLPPCSFQDSCFDFGFWQCHCDASACGLLGSQDMLGHLPWLFLHLFGLRIGHANRSLLPQTVVALRHRLRTFDRFLLPRSL